MIKRLDREKVIAIAVDFQEKLLPAMYEKEALEENVIKLCRGLGVLNIPFLVSQQYTRGLGDTVSTIREAIANFNYIDKSSFSVMREEAFSKELKDTGKKQIILFGIETHICVLQSAMDLIDEGYEVFIVVDCCSSRTAMNRNWGFEMLREVGCEITTVEALLFQLLGGAKAEGFKEVSKIIK